MSNYSLIANFLNKIAGCQPLMQAIVTFLLSMAFVFSLYIVQRIITITICFLFKQKSSSSPEK